MMEAKKKSGVTNNCYVPTDDAKKIHFEHIAEIRKRELSGLENFDKAILAYSTGGLALSLGFLKDFVPIKYAFVSWALYCSWLLFACATCSTVISFLVSGRALQFQEQLSYKYYLEGKEEAFNASNRFNTVTRLLNYLSAACFLIGVILTILFISLNLVQGSNMTQKTRSVVFDGVTIPTMQKIQQPTSQKGLTVPSMQKIPTPPPIQTPPQPIKQKQ